MLKKLQKENKGFTIIEVLIVLAIAGLILLIVFLAVPALQRNSRNTQRKNDVAAVLGAVNEWSNNNQGSLPTTAAQQTVALQNAKLGIYNGQVTWATGAQTNTNTADSIVVVVKAACSPGGSVANDGDAKAGTSRQTAVLYSVETGSGTPSKQCTDS